MRTMKLTAIVLSTFLTASASAQQNTLKGSEISAFLSGATIEGVQDGTAWSQQFNADGSTVYTTAGETQSGRWEVRGDQFCSLWPPSTTWDCYDVTGEGENITFIYPGGSSWPATRISP